MGTKSGKVAEEKPKKPESAAVTDTASDKTVYVGRRAQDKVDKRSRPEGVAKLEERHAKSVGTKQAKDAIPDKIGDYSVIRKLGKGATATVYLVSDPKTGEELALKLIYFHGDNEAMSRRLRKLFQTEDAIGRRLKHPNIIRVFDARIEPDYAYIVMEYVDGVSLESFCSINHLLPLHRVVGIVFKCCLALDYASRQGIVHRDIKPANILIDKDDDPKVADFGLALHLRKDVGEVSTFIMGVGSPAYMSPEQVKNYPLNHKTDLYSLGVLLFQLLTGRLPFRASNQAALIYKIVNQEVPSVCALNPRLPAGLDPIIRKALEKDLYGRYRNGADFAKDLSAVRYQIMEEDTRERDETHFGRLRQMVFFTEFDDLEIWELLRISLWRQFPAKTQLIREGDQNRFFGILVEGSVEVSCEGKSIAQLGAGEVIGEMAFLHPSNATRMATVITLEPCKFLEINCPAFELSSEEVQERLRKILIGKVLERLRNVNKELIKFSGPAIRSTSHACGNTLELESP